MSSRRLAFESPESASPVVTLSVAAGLLRRYHETYTFPAWQTTLLNWIGRLPQEAGRFLVSHFESFTGLKPAQLAGLRSSHLVEERLKDYRDLTGSFPNITIGAALGGASAHLALALNGPFLPQAFVTTVRGGASTGNVREYLDRSLSIAGEIARANEDLITIQHYDPVHDEWMTRFVNHIRFKLIDLPVAYADFIRRRLEPGGAVCYLTCGAAWLRYRLSERSFFQVGGWGDLSPQEFLEGSDRLQRYCQRIGLPHQDWRLPDYPLETGPESEWGSEPGLKEVVAAFCRQEGYRFVEIALPEPHDFSRLAFLAIAELLKLEHKEPAGTLVECFTQFDALAPFEAGFLPLWLVYNTWDSLHFLEKSTAAFPPGKPVFFSPLSTFTQTPDLVPWESWKQALSGFRWTNIGARETHYPADTRALIHWAAPLRNWIEAHPNRIQARLSAEQLARLSSSLHPTVESLSF